MNCDPQRVEEELVNVKLYCSGEVPADVASHKEELIVQRSADSVFGELQLEVVNNGATQPPAPLGSKSTSSPSSLSDSSTSTITSTTTTTDAPRGTTWRLSNDDLSGYRDPFLAGASPSELDLQLEAERAAAYFRGDELFLRRPLNAHSLRVIR